MKPKNYFPIGAAVSSIYVFIIVVAFWGDLVVFLNPAPDKTLDMNNLGDFLAGAFAPLAFFWLVLGYFQQSASFEVQAEELKHSVDALRLQAKALESSVEQQREQFRLTSSMLEIERRRRRGEISPKLSVHIVRDSPVSLTGRFVIEIRNSGYRAFGLEIETYSRKSRVQELLVEGGLLDLMKSCRRQR